MELFADLFNATLAYNPFNAWFCDSAYTGSAYTGSGLTPMLQSGLFLFFISFCHYWEVWNIIHFSFISLIYIQMLLSIMQTPFPGIAPYQLYIFQPLCLLWGFYYMCSAIKEEKNKNRRRHRRTNRNSSENKGEYMSFRNIGMQTN